MWGNLAKLKVKEIHMWSGQRCVLRSASEGDGERSASLEVAWRLGNTQGGSFTQKETLWIAWECVEVLGKLWSLVCCEKMCWVPRFVQSSTAQKEVAGRWRGDGELVVQGGRRSRKSFSCQGGDGERRFARPARG